MKILYGVPGEGMGHATRSKVVIEHLLKNHDVHVVSSSRAFQFLDKNFPKKCTEIKGFHFAYKNAKISKLKTAGKILQSAPRNLIYNFSKYATFKNNFSPDLVISDFESFSFFFAKYHRLPLISIDNMQIIDRCKLEFDIPREEKNNYRVAKGIVKAKVPGCKTYFITTFFYPPVVKKNTELIPPILRKEILETRTKTENHVLVYQTSQSQKNLVEILKTLPGETFFVYGFNKDENYENVVLKSFSERGFVNDLASCKAVIANGGFSLISEAVYFQKPVCSIPIQNQFEQFMNASYIEKLGYGRKFSDLNADSVRSFIYDLENFNKNLQSYSQAGNNTLFEKLDETINQITL